MATDIFEDLNLDQDDINTNLELYCIQSIENANLKLKMVYPNTFFLDNNGNVKYFRKDPYNTGIITYISDQSGAGNAICPVNQCFPALLQTLLNKTSFNNSVANSSTFDITTRGYTFLSNSFNSNSAIVFLGFNDMRCYNINTLVTQNYEFSYTKMLIDLLFFLSVPTNCVVRARDMQVMSGAWSTVNSISGYDRATSELNATLRQSFTNKRYFYISYFYKNANSLASWQITFTCSKTTNFVGYDKCLIPGVINTTSGTPYYSNGSFYDLGENQDFTVDVTYNSSGETNYINVVSAWNDDDIVLYGRDVLLYGVPRVGASYQLTSPYNNLTEEKRFGIIKSMKNAVSLCQKHGLNTFFFESNNIIPVGSDNTNFTPIGQKMLANDIYKYIQLSEK